MHGVRSKTACFVKNMIYIKLHKNNEGFVTAACDEELLNKVLKEGKLALDVSEHFYKGKLVEDKEAEDILRNASNLNLVGKRCIDIALKLKLILKENIITIKGVPHAQAILL